HAVERTRHLHSTLVVRDDYELRALCHLQHLIYEATDVGFVQRRVHLVQQAEWRRTIMEYSQHERKRGHSLFAARKQQHVLKALARRLSYDVYAGFKNVVGVNQGHLAATAAEQFLAERAEVSINLLEC